MKLPIVFEGVDLLTGSQELMTTLAKAAGEKDLSDLLEYYIPERFGAIQKQCRDHQYAPSLGRMLKM